MRITLALAVILTIILVFAYIMRKVRSSPLPFGKRKIEILEITPIMGKWALAIVKVGRRVFLIGMADGTLQIISELSQKDLEEESFDKVLEENL